MWLTAKEDSRQRCRSVIGESFCAVVPAFHDREHVVEHDGHRVQDHQEVLEKTEIARYAHSRCLRLEKKVEREVAEDQRRRNEDEDNIVRLSEFRFLVELPHQPHRRARRCR